MKKSYTKKLTQIERSHERRKKKKELTKMSQKTKIKKKSFFFREKIDLNFNLLILV